MNCNIGKNQTIDINITNEVFTPFACASLISEILKCLLYEKSQIPYPYTWLKNRIQAKRQQEKSETNRNKNMFVEKHYRIASTAFDTFEEILINLKKIFKYNNNIVEVLVLFGATPMNPKEIFRFKIPKLAFGHIECNHINNIIKFQRKIIRPIFMSQEWMYQIEHQLSATNLHLFLKVDESKSIKLDTKTLDFFIPSSTFTLPKSSPSLTVNLLYDENTTYNCCNNLTVYEDDIMKELKNQTETYNSIDKVEFTDNINTGLREIHVDWLKANTIVKGFKENIINNVPASQLW